MAGPAETQVVTDTLRLSVVLKEAGQNKIGMERVCEVELRQALHEIPFTQRRKILVDRSPSLPVAGVPGESQIIGLLQ